MKKYIQILAVAMLVVVAALYTACKKEETSEVLSSEQATVGKFKKEVIVADASGKNWFKLEVSSNNQERLQDFSSSDFAVEFGENAPLLNETSHTPATQIQTPEDNSNDAFILLVEKHQESEGLPMLLKVIPKSAVQSRLTGAQYYYGSCGGGVQAWRYPSAGPKFYFDHRYSGCSNNNWNLVTYGHSYNYSTNKFWGAKVRLYVSGGNVQYYINYY